VDDALERLARQALHARTLRLRHPADDRPCAFEAPVPDDLAGLLAVLREDDVT
jgi:23S rRNA pseudouridine1911/1915/1917 synthase